MLTKAQVVELRGKLTKALAKLGEEVGYRLTLGAGRFGATVVFKLECAPLKEDGTALTQMAENWAAYAPAYGLPADALGRLFTYKGNRYQVSGLNPGRPKYPVTAVRVPDGRGFKFPVAAVLAGLPAAGPKRPDSLILEELRRLETEMSPENLTWDGELAPAKVAQRFQELHERRARLVKELGHEPTHAELYPRPAGRRR